MATDVMLAALDASLQLLTGSEVFLFFVCALLSQVVNKKRRNECSYASGLVFGHLWEAARRFPVSCVIETDTLEVGKNQKSA